jgi:hypothetical protein
LRNEFGQRRAAGKVAKLASVMGRRWEKRKGKGRELFKKAKLIKPMWAA